ncbi:MAG TPA: hypothetical protein VFZ02_14490 [Ktedonobacteraceae bacterium]
MPGHCMVISVLAALVSGGAVAHFSSVAVFLPPVVLVCVMLDAFWRQHAKEEVVQQQQ